MSMHNACYFLNLVLASSVALYSLYLIIHIVCWLLPAKTEPIPNLFHTQVSVIIPARNEEQNIGACLKSILEQDYPANLIEVLICDDHSEDHTKDVALKTLDNRQLRYQYIRVSTSPSNKKSAIEVGIRASSGELLILTDADCTAEKKWISTLVTAYTQSNAIMLCGPVTFRNEKNFCAKFQGLEMCGLSLLSGAGISAGIPLLCNAANIAYTRKAFEAVGGFKDINSSPSGDDTLLMFKLNRKFPGTVHYVKNRNALVYTMAQPTWKDFFNQRIRWASKGFHSKNRLNSIVSLLVFLANFMPLVCIISLFIYPHYLKIIAISLVLKLTVDFLLLSFATIFFRKVNLLLYYPIAIVVVMLYTSLAGIMANFYTYTWKGRNY